MPPRYDWYQSETKVVVTVLLKNAIEKNYTVEIESENVRLTTLSYELNLTLSHPINVERSSHKPYKNKVEIILAKIIGDRWENLEKKLEPEDPPTGPLQLHTTDWDSIAKAEEKAEEENAADEEALQRMFQKVYNNAAPESRMAMNKSFCESGGTVLSTNWDEVSKSKVEVKPPDGAEFRKWE